MSQSPIWRGTRLKVWERDGYACTYCGVACVVDCSKRRPSIDHVIPRSKGGRSDISNLVTACFSCNARKKAKSREEFLGVAV